MKQATKLGNKTERTIECDAAAMILSDDTVHILFVVLHRGGADLSKKGRSNRCRQ